MRTIRIPKRRGGYRTVVCPSDRAKRTLREDLPRLQAIAMTLDLDDVQHGFTPGRSPVTNAARHAGYRWTVSWDLEDCFGHVTQGQIAAIVPRPKPRWFVGGVAAQGLPTSPALANIALSPLDRAIVARLGGRGVYTRYADDLTISTDERSVVDEMLRAMPALCAAHGFPVAARKTKVQCAAAGRRIITGVAVDDDVHPTRDARRRLRAARHRARHRHAAGLAEWCRLRQPQVERKAMQILADCACPECELMARTMLARRRRT